MYLPDFGEERDTLINKAIQEGVERIYLPNIDSSSLPLMKDLCESFPKNCFPMMGLHPCSVKENYKEELSLIEKELKTGNYKAVGEIGMDLHWDLSFVEEQKIAFRKQIEWAKALQLPIVIHSRKAYPEIFKIVEELNDDKLFGIFHCFTDSLKNAEKIISFGGFKMGVGGVVTYKNAGFAEVLKDIDIQHIVLETDAPYLTPVPFRGKRNETAYLIHIAEKVAEVYGISLAEVAEITSKNALEIFERS